MPSNQSGRAADARGEILAAATRLFAAHGFDGVSLQDLADAVGLRKPSLLYHFSSKEELRQAVLDDVLARWNETLPAILLATTGEDQFTGVTKELVGFFARDPDRARLIIREALDRPADMRERLARNVSPVVVKLAHYLRSGQARGNLQEDVDPEAFREESEWRHRLEEEYLMYHHEFRERSRRIPSPGWRSEYVEEIRDLGYDTLLGD